VLFLEPCDVSIYGLIENHMVEGGYRVWGLCTSVERNRDRSKWYSISVYFLVLLAEACNPYLSDRYPFQIQSFLQSHNLALLSHTTRTLSYPLCLSLMGKYSA